MWVVPMRFVSFLQAYGVKGRFTGEYGMYDTNFEPTKSAACGCIMQMMGVQGNADDVLKRLRDGLFGVRVDASPQSPPRVKVSDFQVVKATGHPWVANDEGHLTHWKTPDEVKVLRTASGDFRAKDKGMIFTKKYISGGHFVVAIGFDDRDWANEVASAVADPVRQPWLGRKCCLPDQPICLLEHPVEGSLEEVLCDFEKLPPMATVSDPVGVQENVELELVLETWDVTGETLRDDPVSFQRDGQNVQAKYRVRNIRRKRVMFRADDWINDDGQSDT